MAFSSDRPRSKLPIVLFLLVLVAGGLGAAAWYLRPRFESQAPQVALSTQADVLGSAPFEIRVTDVGTGLKSLSASLSQGGTEFPLAAEQLEVPVPERRIPVALTDIKGLKEGPVVLKVVARDGSLRQSFKGNETVLEKNELIAEVFVPAQGTKKGAYMKVTTGSADDWPALGVAAVIDSDGKSIKSARIVASAATDKATRLKAAEAVVNGKTASDDLPVKAGEAAAAECDYIADVRGSVPYKRELMKVYVRRAIRAALDGKDGAH